jgi:hypothetical protein
MKLNVDLNNVQPMGEYQLIPEGEYKVIITDFNVKRFIEAGNIATVPSGEEEGGDWLEAKFQVIGDNGKGLEHKERYNILWEGEPKEKQELVRNIAKSQLVSLLMAVYNKTKEEVQSMPLDTDDIKDKPLGIVIKHKKYQSKNGEKETANIVKYMPASEVGTDIPGFENTEKKPNWK